VLIGAVDGYAISWRGRAGYLPARRGAYGRSWTLGQLCTGAVIVCGLAPRAGLAQCVACRGPAVAGVNGAPLIATFGAPYQASLNPWEWWSKPSYSGKPKRVLQLMEAVGVDLASRTPRKSERPGVDRSNLVGVRSVHRSSRHYHRYLVAVGRTGADPFGRHYQGRCLPAPREPSLAAIAMISPSQQKLTLADHGGPCRPFSD
jgi:hypothetical protein